MVYLSEIKTKAEYFCGDGLTNTLFVLLLNSCLRELSPVAKKEQIDLFSNVLNDEGKDFATISLSERNLQIMSVLVDDISSFVVGQKEFGYSSSNRGFRRTNYSMGPLVYTIEQDNILLKLGSKAEEIRIKYYVPLKQYDITNAEATDWSAEEVPFREDWFADVITFYIARDFFANFEDEDNVRLYQIMYDRELKRFKSEVARRHLDNSRRYSVPNGHI